MQRITVGLCGIEQDTQTSCTSLFLCDQYIHLRIKVLKFKVKIGVLQTGCTRPFAGYWSRFILRTSNVERSPDAKLRESVGNVDNHNLTIKNFPLAQFADKELSSSFVSKA